MECGYRFVVKSDMIDNLQKVPRSLLHACWCIIVICVYFFSSTMNVYGEVIDRIVAVINDDIITMSEFLGEGEEIYQQLSRGKKGDSLEQALEKVQLDVLSHLIDKRIIHQKAVSMGITVSNAELTKAFDYMLKRDNMDYAGFKEKFAHTGRTIKSYKHLIAERLLQTKLFELEVHSKVVITEPKIKEYYWRKYVVGEMVEGFHILHIGVMWDSSVKQSKLSAKKQADKIRVMAFLKDESFTTLAKEYSGLPSARVGGDAGVVNGKEMDHRMWEVIARMEPGGISEVVETSTGYHIFKLLSKKEGVKQTIAPYESVRMEIQDMARYAAINERYMQWMSKLRGNAHIETRL